MGNAINPKNNDSNPLTRAKKHLVKKKYPNSSIDTGMASSMIHLPIA